MFTLSKAFLSLIFWQVLDSAAQQAMSTTGDKHPHMIIVILPQSAAEIRSKVKFWGDAFRGVATQCVVSLSTSYGITMLQS